MPSLMVARWVGQNSGAIFRHLWTKVHQSKFACAGVSVVCNAVFLLTMSCCVPEMLSIKLRSCPKSRQNLMFLGRQISGRKGHHKSGLPLNTWQSLVTIGHTTSVIRWQKKEREDLNDSGKTEWPVAGGHNDRSML